MNQQILIQVHEDFQQQVLYLLKNFQNNLHDLYLMMIHHSIILFHTMKLDQHYQHLIMMMKPNHHLLRIRMILSKKNKKIDLLEFTLVRFPSIDLVLISSVNISSQNLSLLRLEYYKSYNRVLEYSISFFPMLFPLIKSNICLSMENKIIFFLEGSTTEVVLNDV
jgi:hypothetical protein